MTEIVIAGYETFRKAPMVFIATSIVLTAPQRMFGLWLEEVAKEVRTRGSVPSETVALALVGCALAVIAYLVTITACMAIADGIENNSEPGFAMMARTAIRALPAIAGVALWTGLMYATIVTGLGISVGAIGNLAGEPGEMKNLVVGSASMAIAIAGLIMMVARYQLAFPIALFERKDSIEAIRRSAVVSRGVRLRIVVISILFNIDIGIIFSLLHWILSNFGTVGAVVDIAVFSAIPFNALMIYGIYCRLCVPDGYVPA